MCVDINGELVLAVADIIAYKLVRRRADGRYGSAFLPEDRASQYKNTQVGRFRTYKIGHIHQSTMDRTPGFYCYAELGGAKYHHRAGQAILQVRIPAGTRMRYATQRTYPAYPDWPVLLVERLVVVEEVFSHWQA